jgi:hypothetical protein
MVHTTNASSESRPMNRQRRLAQLSDALDPESGAPMRYVFIPDPLIASFARDPLAIGIYVAVARLAVVVKGAVPLAARDLVAWMGSDREADRAAIMRRIVKLAQKGWLCVERSEVEKNRLIPTWGRDQSGAARPWRFDTADSGKPDYIRGRRLPLTLLDDYLGRLEPQHGPGRALISRYFTQPLLDLVDIGVYTIGLRAEITPTPRLRHLGLHQTAGMFPPPDTRALLALAAVGTLTTLEDDAVTAVQLSIQGHARLGIAPPLAMQRGLLDTEPVCGSLHGSADGSADGSRNLPNECIGLEEQDGQKSVPDPTRLLIAWDVGMISESINHDSAPTHAVAAGSTAINADRVAATRNIQAQISTTARHYPPQPASDDVTQMPVALAALVIAGHRALNPDRTILPGEWCEVQALQAEYGVNQLLIWQTRARRAERERPCGINPAYYSACATQAAHNAYASTTPCHCDTPESAARTQRSASPTTALDPASDALLRALGVRERQTLASVPYDLIATWQTALAHPGMLAQFTTPVGFAVRQMQRGNPPPPIAELDRWADHARRKDDRYETWRHMDVPPLAANTTSYEQALEERVRGIAPRNADSGDLCLLANAIESGATDLEALACLTAGHRGGRR